MLATAWRKLNWTSVLRTIRLPAAALRPFRAGPSRRLRGPDALARIVADLPLDSADASSRTPVTPSVIGPSATITPGDIDPLLAPPVPTAAPTLTPTVRPTDPLAARAISPDSKRRGLTVAPIARIVRQALEPIGIELLEGSFRRNLEALPPLPELTLKILRELGDESSSARSVARLAALDPALSATLLRTANSAAYSPVRPVTAVTDAVAFLGFSAVRTLLLRLKLDDLVGTGHATSEIEEIWTHAVVVSHVAERLAPRFSAERALCGTLGLLHDIGKLVIARTRPDEAARLATPGPGDESRLARERRVLGADHGAIGAHLASRWQLPGAIVEGIRHHHAPHLMGHGPVAVQAIDAGNLPGADEPSRRACAVVFVANQVAKYLHAYCDDTEIDIPHPEIIAMLGIPPCPGDLIDAPIRKAVGDALLLAAASLGRAPGATARLIRITPPGQRNLAIDNAMLSEGDPAGLTIDTGSASALVFRAAGGDATDFHSGSPQQDTEALAAIERAMDRFDAPHDVARRIGLSLNWLTHSLRRSEPSATIDFVISCQSGRFSACVRSEALRFDRRFGGHLNPRVAARVLESECAGVINLAWFQEVRCSEDGGALLLAA